MSEAKVYSDKIIRKLKWLGVVGLIATFCFSGFLLAVGVSEKETYTKAEIYYYGWEVMTRMALNSEHVRQSHKIKIIITDEFEIEKLLNEWIEPKKMKHWEKPYYPDVRLVIDLFDSDGNRTTFSAGRFFLVSGEKKRREIDNRFRAKFEF